MIKRTLSRLIHTGFFHIFGSGLLNKVIAFLSSFILIRIISKYEYGVYSYAQNIVNLFMIVSGLGIVSGLMQIFCENSTDKPKIHAYLKKGARFGIFVNLILALIIFIYSFFVDASFEGLQLQLRLMTLIPLCDLCFELIQIYYRGTIENKKYSYLSTINSILILVFSIVGALLYGAVGLIILRICASVVSVLIAIIFLKFPIHEIWKAPIGSLDEWKVVLKLSVISMLCNSASIIMQNIDGLLLGELLTDADIVASYKVATYIPTGLTFIPQMLVIYIYPMFVSRMQDKAWMKQAYRKIILAFGAFNLVLTAIVIIFSKQLVPFLFGAQYTDAVVPLNILMVTYFFNATFRNISGNLLASQRRVKANLVFGIIGIVINIIGDILLIPRYGAMGAAFATLAVVVCVSIMSSVYLTRVFNQKAVVK